MRGWVRLRWWRRRCCTRRTRITTTCTGIGEPPTPRYTRYMMRPSRREVLGSSLCGSFQLPLIEMQVDLSASPCENVQTSPHDDHIDAPPITITTTTTTTTTTTITTLLNLITTHTHTHTQTQKQRCSRRPALIV